METENLREDSQQRKLSEKTLREISGEKSQWRQKISEKILSRENPQRKLSEKSQERNLSGVEDSQERILSREKLRRKSLTVRRTECPVCGKEVVSLKNTGRFVREHNCSSDEAHL